MPDLEERFLDDVSIQCEDDGQRETERIETATLITPDAELLADELASAGDWSWMQLRVVLVMVYQWVSGSMQTYGSVFFAYHEICHKSDPSCSHPVTLDNICTNGTRNSDYIFNPRMSSVVEDFNLICARAWWLNLAVSLWFIGFLGGVSLFGRISDRWGRVVALYGVIALGAFACALQAICPNVEVYCAARLLNGMSVGAGGMCTFILASELSRAHRSIWIAAFANASFGTGYALLALLAYLIRHWRPLCWVNAGSYAAYLILLVPQYKLVESPSWLVSRGRLQDAAAAMTRVAKINGRDFESSIAERLGDGTSCTTPLASTASPDSWTQMFLHPILRKRLIAIGIVWYFANGAYYGVGLNISTLNFGASVYFTAVLIALIDLPSAATAGLLPHYIGRKPFTWIGCAMGGSLCVMSSMTHPGVLALVFCLASRFFVNAVFDLMYSYSYELVPTSLRNQSCGLLSTVGHLGAATFSAWAPAIGSDVIPGVHSTVLFVVGVPFLLSSLLVLVVLPETRLKPLALMCSDL